jgi:hypothetical protein
VWRLATEKKHNAFSVMCSSIGSMPGRITPPADAAFQLLAQFASISREFDCFPSSDWSGRGKNLAGIAQHRTRSGRTQAWRIAS